MIYYCLFSFNSNLINARDFNDFNNYGIFSTLNTSPFVENNEFKRKLEEKISESKAKENSEIIKRLVVPCGIPFGIKMFSHGTMIVGISNVRTRVSVEKPAQLAGLKKGDIIEKINDKEISSNETLAREIQTSKGEKIKICVNRNGNKFEISTNPVKSADDEEFKIGIWVKNSAAGVGTMTFYQPDTRVFSGLGHGIYDNDTEILFPMENGKIYQTTITRTVPGYSGKPGELIGGIMSKSPIGEIFNNSKYGIHGVLKQDLKSITIYENGQLVLNPIEIAKKSEVKTGKAEILTTTNGNMPKKYEIVIENTNKNPDPTKSIFFNVIDEDLLSKTHGIVQGMSGSPIIQNGKLVGAVTHVVVNNPKKGYGIFAEKMLEENHNLNQEIYNNL